MAKILCVLYPDPVTGYPPTYARDSIPTLRNYPDGQTLPTLSKIDFTPGQLLASHREHGTRGDCGPGRRGSGPGVGSAGWLRR